MGLGMWPIIRTNHQCRDSFVMGVHIFVVAYFFWLSGFLSIFHGVPDWLYIRAPAKPTSQTMAVSGQPLLLNHQTPAVLNGLIVQKSCFNPTIFCTRPG